MSRREVSLPLLATLLLLAAVVVEGFPTPHEDDGNSSGSRPFIEFTKGGIRVNFAGYHAQAGLGGLLTGRTADGGLHASAGTPAGAHASAGLGGSLDGGPTGGLHARAGLGNGGPEAEAGLGGTLSGSKPQGEIFAKSSAGGLVLPQKTIGKNIQVIEPKRNDQQVSSSSASVDASAAASTNDAVIADERSQSPARLYFQKRLHERVTQSSPYYDSLKNAQAETAPKATTDKEPTTSTSKSSPPPQPHVKLNAPGVFTRAVSGVDAATNAGSSTSNNLGYKKKTTLFDDIFNIPISALNAVNQLLRNHVGKK
ncbi:uncharacterized protein LOC131671724 isoform X1 [Phymastichus coffea]|uniref:uncharacterized protein LOC131671724 isoform X1 n=1 Tax=Phymastichus coffea TaxID=108790 RepID=UPI00273ACF01|nr:uncharacterized protein LOC131671724 isoform X1 [Phymastichus coffea]